MSLLQRGVAVNINRFGDQLRLPASSTVSSALNTGHFWSHTLEIRIFVYSAAHR